MQLNGDIYFPVLGKSFVFTFLPADYDPPMSFFVKINTYVLFQCMKTCVYRLSDLVTGRPGHGCFIVRFQYVQIAVQMPTNLISNVKLSKTAH